MRTDSLESAANIYNSQRADIERLRELLTRIYGWDMMDVAADGPYWRQEMRKLGIKHPDPARPEATA